MGGHPLRGSIAINGAKNAALPLMTTCLLTSEPLILEGIPQVADIRMMHLLLEDLGVQVHQFQKCFSLDASQLRSHQASYEFVRKMRASIVVLGALLGREGQAEVSLPGGCAIGVRPVNFHLEGLKALGATIDLHQGYVIATSPKGGLPGGYYSFPKPSVTGTQNLLFAAVLAKGESCIDNAALEPEIIDLVHCLRKMGACIHGEGTPTLRIQGRPSLTGANHAILPDRIEMGTYMMAAAITSGDLILEGCDVNLLPGVNTILQEIGVNIDLLEANRVRVWAQHPLKSFDIETSPFPGIPTDLQAQFMALATIAQGESRITETIWENRFMHVPELARMGATIHLQGHQAIITGGAHLRGAQVMATDLRASVSLVLAGLAAEGETLIRRVYHLDRGYEKLEEKLSMCGAVIHRLTDDSSSYEDLTATAS
jgi:UDP-N-acetylglucosamine 1-carboxyvinyltransferase